MSLELPAHPSLVHLKQQAKDRLTELRLAESNAQLSDALHAVAHDYGFKSWPELKAHVERVANDDGMPTKGPHSLAGRWSAAGASLRSLGVAPLKSADLEFTIVGPHVTITQWLVDDAGRETRATSAIDADGVEHRYAETKHGILARWSGRTLEVNTSVDGKPASKVSYSIAEDGGSLTLDASSVAHDRFPAVRHHATFARQTFR